MTTKLLAAVYLLIGAAVSLWWFESTEHTGSSRTTRAVGALAGAFLWLPALVTLYGLRALAWARRRL